MIEEKEIVNGCVAGKPYFQKMLYKQYAGMVMSICLRYAKNNEEAEDFLQDVFVKVFLNLKTFKFNSHLGYWIKRLAINEMVSAMRRKNATHFAISTDDLQHDIADVTVKGDVSVPMDVLLKMVNELPDGYRTVFNMREIDGYEFGEIAKINGFGEATARSQLYKAKNVLKAKIEKYLSTEIR